MEINLMKLSGSNKKAKKFKFRITEPDREWVKDNFQWLISVYGYPDSFNGPFLIDANYFPRTFNSPNVTIENLIGDLASLLELDSTKITFELKEDLRDTYGIPYEIHDKPFESETLITENARQKMSNALGVNSDAIKNFSEEAVFNQFNNTLNDNSSLSQNYQCTFNPIDKWAEAIEENKKLYEALLESERKRIALLEKLLEEKK